MYTIRLPRICRDGTSIFLIHTCSLCPLDFVEQGCANDVTLYTWNHKICHGKGKGAIDGDYVEYRHPNATEMSLEWFKKKKILFIGDSHMEGLVSLFAEHVCRCVLERYELRPSVPKSLQYNALLLVITFITYRLCLQIQSPGVQEEN